MISLLREPWGLSRGALSSLLSMPEVQDLSPRGSEAKVRFPSETLNHFGSHVEWDKHAFPGRRKVSPRGYAEIPQKIERWSCFSLEPKNLEFHQADPSHSIDASIEARAGQEQS